jgi:hypothetical protein
MLAGTMESIVVARPPLSEGVGVGLPVGVGVLDGVGVVVVGDGVGVVVVVVVENVAEVVVAKMLLFTMYALGFTRFALGVGVGFEREVSLGARDVDGAGLIFGETVEPGAAVGLRVGAVPGVEEIVGVPEAAGVGMSEESVASSLAAF